MKNKKLTWFLIVVVAGVWGMILYRIFAAVGSSDDMSAVPTIKPQMEVYNDFTIPKDTTKLLLNYRDPFGLTKQKDTTMKLVKISSSTQKALSIKPSINWSFITYSGYIRNPASKRLVTLVNINGQNLTLTEGETKNQVKLLKNLKDSIKISYQGKTKFIVIKSATL
jgi:hypothetical protein